MEAIEAANANGNVRGRCFWWRGEWRKLKLTLMGIHRRKSRVVWTAMGDQIVSLNFIMFASGNKNNN
jgi:hypothetical protein